MALARALAKQPKLLLLDEPLGALDKKLREQTQFEIMNIQEKTGITFIVVTHDQEEAMTLATRIAVMDQGVIRQIGTPTEIYEFPRSRFVADFIGSINHVRGHGQLLGERQGRSSPAQDWGTRSHGRAARKRLPSAARSSVAVRPEKIAIDRNKPDRRRQCRCRARSSISAISARIRSIA